MELIDINREISPSIEIHGCIKFIPPTDDGDRLPLQLCTLDLLRLINGFASKFKTYAQQNERKTWWTVTNLIGRFGYIG